jgi:enoyl-CoA hydratase/carnithine racemase
MFRNSYSKRQEEPAMAQFIETARDGRVLTITLNRPDVLNALHAPACFEISDALDRFVADPDLWVAIITGAGRAFCAGHDLLAAPDEKMPASGWAGISERQDIDKPIIAALNGGAYGGGLEIALACDIIVAAENAIMGLTEPKWCAVALGGGIERLQRRIPRNIANAMLLAGKTLNAAEAQSWGLVNEVVPAADVMTAARRWAGEILALAPLAVRHTKKIARDSIEDEAFTARMAARRRHVADAIFRTEDIKEGIAAFREKRRPVWQGR